MPPPKYPSPPVQLRALLEESRRAGLDFEAAWADAMKPGRIKHLHNTDERRGWKEGVAVTKDEWQASYEGRPTQVSEVLGRVVLERDEARDPSALRLVA